MNAKQCGNWMIDLDDLTCRNTKNDLLIVFERKGFALHGRIQTIPMCLAQELMANPDNSTDIRKAVIEADEVFFREYFAHQMSKNSGTDNKYMRKSYNP